MDKEIMNKVFSYIDALAAKLGVASEYVFEVLVRQKFIEGIVYTVIILAITAISIPVYIRIVKWIIKKGYDENYEIDDYFLEGFFPMIIFGFHFISVIKFLPESILKMSNPAYYALKEILEVLGK